MKLNELAKEIHINSIEHGWWDEPRNFGEIIEYTSLNYPFKIQTNIKTNYLDISILDDDNNIFDNNNYNWVGIIKFE